MNNKGSLAIRNGLLLDPAERLEGKYDLLLKDGRVTEVAAPGALSDDGKPILDDKIMRQTLAAAAALNMPVVQHAEDCRMTEGSAMNAGLTAFRLGLRGWPAEAESSIVERDIRLAAETKARYHVAHLSTAGALRAVRKAKRDH